MLHVSHLLFKYSSVLIVNIPDLFQSPCSSSPCQNGGTCIPNYDFNSHDCLCAQGFVGEYCEKGNWYVSIPSSLFQRFVSTNFPSEEVLFDDSRVQLPENTWSDTSLYARRISLIISCSNASCYNIRIYVSGREISTRLIHNQTYDI